MSTKIFSAVKLSLLFAVLVGSIVLAGCGGSSSASTTTTTPAVGLSSSSLTFSSGVGVTSASQSVTVTDTGTASVTFTGIVASTGFAETNTCGTGIVASGTCTISVTFTPTAAGAANGTLTLTDNVGTQTVTLTGTGSSASLSANSLTISGVAVGTTSAAQSVTLNNAGTAALAITSIAVTTGASNFSQTNTCGSSVAAGGSCTISVTFTPTASGAVTGTLTIVDGAGTQTVTLTGSTSVANTAEVDVNFGPNGSGPVTPTSNPYFNGIYTTVTVCAPGSTTNCATVPNVLVDTGSVGLRVLSSALGSVTLPQVNDSASGYPVYACVQFGDLSYTWGPMQMANVQVGGETASQLPAAVGGTANSGIPIQVIANANPPTNVGLAGSNNSYYNQCLVYPGTSTLTGLGNSDTVATLGSNGILGIGNFAQDCGIACESISNTSGQYLICLTVGSSSCDIQAVSLLAQAWNPVSAFPVDNNGVVLQLPAIPAAGQATATGTLYFGIGTQSNNAIPSGATVFELDNYGDFNTAVYNGITYTSTNSNGSFLDTGSNALFVSDPTTLGIPDCLVGGTDIGFFCPTSSLNLSLGLTGTNGTSTTVSLPVANALTLFSNATFAAFNDLGGPSCVAATGSPCTAATDSWDLGLPFFFGRTIAVGIAGGATYPNGYWAF
jgi:hypothetical protein